MRAHACTQLEITRVALASSVNAIGLVFNKARVFDYLPLDEAHPCRPDEAYGVSKLYVIPPSLRIRDADRDAACSKRRRTR
jgi:GDP-D-mannose dehydratase